MKNALILLLVAALAGVSVLAVKQYHKYSDRDKQVQALKVEAEKAKAEAAEIEKEHQRAAEKAASLVRLSEELGTALKEAQAATNKPSSAKVEADGSSAQSQSETKSGKQSAFGKLLASIMEDPDMKKMIRDQQRGMVDQMYDPLIDKLGLTPDAATKLKELVLDNMSQSTEKATAMFGEAGSTNRTAAIQEMAAQQKQMDEQVKDLLGDKYGDYKEYQETLGERTQLNMFRQQLVGDRSLSDEQTERLLKLMNEEKRAVAASTGQPLPGAANQAEGLEALMSEDATTKMLESQETVNQRVFDRAKEVLTPEQLKSFGDFQANQLKMMRTGLNMARKFVAPDRTSATDQAR